LYSTPMAGGLVEARIDPVSAFTHILVLIQTDLRDTPNVNVIFSMPKLKHCKIRSASVTRTQLTDCFWPKSNV
jgi:hypothetical protein